MNPLLFTDPAFLFLFLPVVLAGYHLMPRRGRNPFLLGTSLLLYAWGQEIYGLVLVASIAVNYSFGLAISRNKPPARNILLLCAVALNVVLLGAFKYTAFLVENYNVMATHLGIASLRVPQVPLPIGVSFYTFMGISYLVDAYRDGAEVEPSASRFALYLSLFPHLIAGPIVRYSDIAGQLGERIIHAHDFGTGIRRFTVGLGKKILVANAMGSTVDAIMRLHRASLTAPLAWLGIVCYTLQIYYDFSGYSDMAIGLARMFGFKFPENFNYPYTSRSITEFWRRWHMSLSSWLRDYLFFPLGVRGPLARRYVNILVVFAVCGLWHGASWHFVAWGLFQGLLLIVERLGLLKALGYLPRFVGHVYALFAILIGWVLFRADNLRVAQGYLSAMFSRSYGPVAAYLTPSLVIIGAAGVVGCTPVAPVLNRWFAERVEELHTRTAALLQTFAGLLRIAFDGAILSGCMILIASNTYSPFIYFRF